MPLCPGTELNRYLHCCKQDFKSCVSTSFTTGANTSPTLSKGEERQKKTPVSGGSQCERKTGLEPATSTLARSRSTK